MKHNKVLFSDRFTLDALEDLKKYFLPSKQQYWQSCITELVPKFYSLFSIIFTIVIFVCTECKFQGLDVKNKTLWIGFVGLDAKLGKKTTTKKPHSAN